VAGGAQFAERGGQAGGLIVILRYSHPPTLRLLSSGRRRQRLSGRF
jgi:hypothetical protein